MDELFEVNQFQDADYQYEQYLLEQAEKSEFFAVFERTGTYPM